VWLPEILISGKSWGAWSKRGHDYALDDFSEILISKAWTTTINKCFKGENAISIHHITSRSTTKKELNVRETLIAPKMIEKISLPDLKGDRIVHCTRAFSSYFSMIIYLANIDRGN